MIDAPLSRNRNSCTTSYVPIEGVDAKTKESRTEDKQGQEHCGREGGMNDIEGYKQLTAKGMIRRETLSSLRRLVTSLWKRKLSMKTLSPDQIFARSNVTGISQSNGSAWLLRNIGWKPRTSARVRMANARWRCSSHPHELPYLDLERRKGRS